MLWHNASFYTLFDVENKSHFFFLLNTSNVDLNTLHATLILLNSFNNKNYHDVPLRKIFYINHFKFPGILCGYDVTLVMLT